MSTVFTMLEFLCYPSDLKCDNCMLPARSFQACENFNIYLFTLTSRIIIYILQCKPSKRTHWNLRLKLVSCAMFSVTIYLSLYIADDAHFWLRAVLTKEKRFRNVLLEMLIGQFVIQTFIPCCLMVFGTKYQKDWRELMDF